MGRIAALRAFLFLDLDLRVDGPLQFRQRVFHSVHRFLTPKERTKALPNITSVTSSISVLIWMLVWGYCFVKIYFCSSGQVLTSLRRQISFGDEIFHYSVESMVRSVFTGALEPPAAKPVSLTAFPCSWVGILENIKLFWTF